MPLPPFVWWTINSFSSVRNPVITILLCKKSSFEMGSWLDSVLKILLCAFNKAFKGWEYWMILVKISVGGIQKFFRWNFLCSFSFEIDCSLVFFTSTNACRNFSFWRELYFGKLVNGMSHKVKCVFLHLMRDLYCRLFLVCMRIFYELKLKLLSCITTCMYIFR